MQAITIREPAFYGSAKDWPEEWQIALIAAIFFLAAVSLILVALLVLAELAERWPKQFLRTFEWLDDRSLGWILDRWDAWKFNREVKRSGDSPGQVAMRKLMIGAAYRLELGERPQDVWDSIQESHVRIHREHGPIPMVSQLNYIVYRHFQEVCTDRGLIPPVYVEPDFSYTS